MSFYAAIFSDGVKIPCLRIDDEGVLRRNEGYGVVTGDGVRCCTLERPQLAFIEGSDTQVIAVHLMWVDGTYPDRNFLLYEDLPDEVKRVLPAPPRRAVL